MRTLQPANRRRVGLMGVAVTALVVAVGQTFTSVPVLFAQPSYYGQFPDTGGLNTGDRVRITGIDVGKIESIAIAGKHVVMKFTTGSQTIGTQSRLAIKTDTILGKKVLEIEPRGTQTLRPGQTLPLGQSTTPYQIYDAFFDVTKAAAGWDIDSVKQSLNVLSHTVTETSPHLSAALDGVARFSDTIGKRDEQIQHLLAQARRVAGVLGQRREQIDKLLVNANTLLEAFNERSQAIAALLSKIAAFSSQVQGLITDNPGLHHVLEQLRTISDLLVKHKHDLVETLTILSNFISSISEAVSSGPYFKVMLANLLPYQILQPWVDAAFKKRGIDPADFWRSAGLPAFRFPDPNGTRLPNGAPPPAPPVREGTPDHPGPAVSPGSPCSLAPPRDGIPTPANPLPCAGLSVGPFGDNPYGPNYPAPVDVQTAPPQPHGLPATPGIPVAGRPGEQPPALPGTPVPMPPPVAPGARTLPLAPAATPPSPATVPPAPPRPGPGPQLPAPFITPDGTGGSSQ